MAFFRSVATVGFFAMISRALGFVRDLVTAILLGAGPVADAYVLAQRLPNFFRVFFAESAADSAFIPIYSRKLRMEGKAAAQKFTREVLTILLLTLLPFTGLCMLFIPQIVSVLAPGFVNDPERFHLAVTYSGITFGYLVLISLTAIQGGILNAHGRFVPFAVAPVILNVVMIVALIGAAVLEKDAGLIGSWALIVGGALQLALLWFSCARAGVKLALAWPRLTKDVRQFFHLIGPWMLGTGVTELSGLFSTMFASGLSVGVVAALYYVDRLLQLPVGVVAVAIATALLPLITRHIAAKEKDRVVHFFSRAMEFSLALSLPATVIFMFEAEPIIHVLFQHGVFTHDNTVLTAECLMAYAPIIPAFVLTRLLTICYFAAEDTRTPVVVGFVGLIANLAAAFVLVPLWQHIGIAVAFTLSTWISLILLTVYLLKKPFFQLDAQAKHRLPRVVLSTVALAVVLGALNALLEESKAHSVLESAGMLALRLLAGGLAYLATVHFTGAMNFNEIAKMLRKKPSAIPESDA